MMNILSSDNSILVTKIPLCDFDLKVNPDILNFSVLTEDTLTVDLSGNGTLGSKLFADVILSTNPLNQITVDPAGGLLVLPGNAPAAGCDSVYTDANGEPWVDTTAANAAFQALDPDCQYQGYTILSYDEAGNEQEYWYKNAITGVGDLIKKNDYSYSGGANSIAGGDPYNIAGNENAVSLGRGVFTGEAFFPTAWTQGTLTMRVTRAAAADFPNGTNVVVVDYYNAGADHWFGTTTGATNVLDGGGNIIAVDVVLSADPYATIGVPFDSSTTTLIIPEIDNTKAATVAIGLGTAAYNRGAIAIGAGAYARDWGALALGNAIAIGANGVAIGPGSETYGQAFAASGGYAETNGVAFWGKAYQTSFCASLYGTADASVGAGVTKFGNTAFCAGYYNHAHNYANVALGAFSLASNPHQIAVGPGEFITYNFDHGASQWAVDHMILVTTDATENQHLKFILDTDYVYNAGTGVGQNAFVVRTSMGTLEGTLLATEIERWEVIAGVNTQIHANSKNAKWTFSLDWVNGAITNVVITDGTGLLDPATTGWTFNISSAVVNNVLEIYFRVTGDVDSTEGVRWYATIKSQSLSDRVNIP